MLKSLHLQGADTAEREVRLLIDAIAASHCDFTRNGRQHTAEEAATHLALGTRHLALGTWHSALGTWHLALGTWNLELGTWNSNTLERENTSIRLRRLLRN